MKIARCPDCSWQAQLAPDGTVPEHRCRPLDPALTCALCDWRRPLLGDETPEHKRALLTVHSMRPGHQLSTAAAG